MAFRQKKLTEMKNDFINKHDARVQNTDIVDIACGTDAQRSKVRKSPAMLQQISTVITDENQTPALSG